MSRRTAGGPLRGLHPALAAAAGLTGLLTWAILRIRSSADMDLWLHLRVGRLLAGGGRFGLPDPLTELPDVAYVPSQWLAQVAMVGVQDWFGGAGIQAVRLGLVLALVGLVLLACRQWASPVPAAVATLLATYGTTAAWSERPQLAGVVLLAGTYAAWLRAARTRRPPWMLVPVAWLWAGLHGSWPLGIGLGVLVCAGLWLDDRGARSAVPRLLLVPLASLVVTALTPLGPGLLLNPVEVSLALRGRVNEWLPPALDNPLLLGPALSAVLVLLVWARRRHTTAGRALLLLAGVVATFSAVRTMAVGAVLLAPLLAQALESLRGPATEPERGTRAEWWTWGAAALLTVVLCLPLLTAPRTSPVPASVDAAVAGLPAGTVAEVEVGVSGWFLWAHPGVRPLRDLRSEAYSLPVARAHESFTRCGTGWQAYAEEHEVAAAVVTRDGPLDGCLRGAGWRELAREGGFAVWRHPARS